MQILIPVDGSKHSDHAIAFVASRATLIGTDPDVELMNVQQSVPPRVAQRAGGATLDEYYRIESNKVLEPALATLGRAELEARCTYRVGNVADEIAAAAQQDGRDLIVMGSHGHGPLMGLILGSTARGVMARTKTPILLLRDRAAPKSDSLKVGIAIDGSRAGLQAVKFVLRHPDIFGARPDIAVIHVLPELTSSLLPDIAGVAAPRPSGEEIEKQIDSAYEEAVAPARRLFVKAGFPFREKRLTGPAGDGIAKYAAKQKLDVLVLGSHGHGAFRSAVMGSVAQRVAAHCKTPLILVR